mgnify:CR=1 FL=1
MEEHISFSRHNLQTMRTLSITRQSPPFIFAHSTARRKRWFAKRRRFSSLAFSCSFWATAFFPPLKMNRIFSTERPTFTGSHSNRNEVFSVMSLWALSNTRRRNWPKSDWKDFGVSRNLCKSAIATIASPSLRLPSDLVISNIRWEYRLGRDRYSVRL